jgi:hypothetical protein
VNLRLKILKKKSSELVRAIARRSSHTMIRAILWIAIVLYGASCKDARQAKPTAAIDSAPAGKGEKPYVATRDDYYKDQVATTKLRVLIILLQEITLTG